MPKIQMTVRELTDRGLWDDACQELGLNPYCKSEGRIRDDEVLTLTPKLARLCGFDVPDPEPPPGLTCYLFVPAADAALDVAGTSTLAAGLPVWIGAGLEAAPRAWALRVPLDAPAGSEVAILCTQEQLAGLYARLHEILHGED